MHKKLTASAATGLLLLGASSVAMAQDSPLTLPPLVVASVQATVDVTAAGAIAVGSPCVDAVQALRTVPLDLQSITPIQGNFLTFVFGGARGAGASAAILICALDLIPGTPPPPPPG
jgi:hypothetical protein